MNVVGIDTRHDARHIKLKYIQTVRVMKMIVIIGRLRINKLSFCKNQDI